MAKRAKTRGAVALAKIIRAKKLQQTDIASALRGESGRPCHKGTVCHWLRGSRLPGRAYARQLERLWGIRVEWWEKPQAA